LQEHFKELVKAYQTYKSPPSGTSPEDLQDLKRKSELASSTFRASFGQRLDQNPNVLQSSTTIEVLMTWTSEMLPLQTGNAVMQKEESFDDTEAFSNRLQELTSVTLGSLHASLWPFIRKLKYAHLRIIYQTRLNIS
jgi:hypothetical protein